MPAGFLVEILRKFRLIIDANPNLVFNGNHRSGSVGSTGISCRANGVEMQKQNITVKLETVTPLFLGGAEPRGEPELRPPAFRGAMRHWLQVEVVL